MKNLMITLFLFFVSLIQSQELKTVEISSPEATELADLSFLKEELQGKKLVMLGEQTHMYGNIFEMKSRVVEYLHKELGFNTIAMESSMYDIWKMNKRGFNSKDFNNAIWGVWSSSTEFQRLVNYIEKNNIKIIGFDSQVNNVSLFIDDFFTYLQENNIELKLDKDDLGIIIEGVLENVTVEETDILFKVYESELKRIIELISKLNQNNTNYHWKQFIKGLLACSQDAYNKDEILTMDFGNKNHNIRDKQMADNLLSYIDRNPDEKIIAWADNIHIINDNSSIEKPIIKEFISMGSYIHKKLKNKSYSLATIHANDSILDLQTKKWHRTVIKKTSFEHELNKLKKPYLFVSSNQKAMQLKKATRLLNFIDFTEVKLNELHDGYIFFQKATLPTLGNNASSFKNPTDKDVTIKSINSDKKIILKGQIIDQKNKEPIPFATLILKNEEIYRVANENGYFQLPLNKKTIKNAIVSISSLGYETKSIRLSNLKEKIVLKPNYEVLEEVVITGYLSPKTVLKKAILKKEINHPTKPFNFYRYGKVFINKNDVNELDLELITKDEDKGYLSPFIITQKMKQIKWNKNIYPKKYKYSSQFFAYRQNAIRFANILHKRKYKKFKLNFIKSNLIKDQNIYIIAFQTERNKWNYTNRGYPTKYSGRVYINKENFAIIKVVENWETTLNQEEIEKQFKGLKKYKNIIETTIKEENICMYSKINNDENYYATRYFNRKYSESLNNKNEKVHEVFEVDSHLYNFELTNVENIEFEWREKKQTVLNGVKYDETFWSSFYDKNLKN